MRTIFDFGLYDAADSLYYLENGFNVRTFEANPLLFESVPGYQFWSIAQNCPSRRLQTPPTTALLTASPTSHRFKGQHARDSARAFVVRQTCDSCVYAT